MESLTAQYEKDGLVSIAIVVQSSSRTPPTAQTCKSWRSAGKHVKVYTLYDKFYRTRDFPERPYTALNVWVNKQHVITGKQHTDRDADLIREIKKSLGIP